MSPVGKRSSQNHINLCSRSEDHAPHNNIAEHVRPSMQVQNGLGEAESEDAYILVESVDIFGMIERHLETKRMTLKSLFMQFLRSQVS